MTTIQIPGFQQPIGLPAPGADAEVRALDPTPLVAEVERLLAARQRATDVLTAAFARRNATEELRQEMLRRSARTRMPMTQAAIERGRR